MRRLFRVPSLCVKAVVLLLLLNFVAMLLMLENQRSPSADTVPFWRVASPNIRGPPPSSLSENSVMASQALLGTFDRVLADRLQSQSLQLKEEFLKQSSQMEQRLQQYWNVQMKDLVAGLVKEIHNETIQASHFIVEQMSNETQKKLNKQLSLLLEATDTNAIPRSKSSSRNATRLACDSLFGWNATSFKGRCLVHSEIKWKACRLGSLQINPEMILGPKGGEEIAAVMNRDENLELLQFKRGAMTGSLEKTPLLDDKIMKTFSATAREILKSLVIDENLMPSTQNILKHPNTTALLVTRGDYANPCLTISSIYNVFLVLLKFQLSDFSFNITTHQVLGPSYQIVWLDGHAKGQLDDVWSHLFGAENVVRVKHLRQEQAYFADSILVNSIGAFNDAGLWLHDGRKPSCRPETSSLHRFRDFVLEKYGLLELHRRNSLNPTGILTLLVRTDYLPHPRSTGKTDRVLANVTDDVDYIQSQFPRKQVRVVSFENITFRQQLFRIVSTEILVAVHGAGNIHVIFLPEGSRFTEYAPPNFESRRRFQYLAWCMGNKHEQRNAFVVDKFEQGSKISVRLRPSKLDDINKAATPTHGKFMITSKDIPYLLNSERNQKKR
jgi:hypothetical protein